MAKFCSIFPILGAKKMFPENLTLSSTTSYGFIAPCQNLEKKLMIQFQENAWTDGRTRRTERPYFVGPFWLLPGIQKWSKS